MLAMEAASQTPSRKPSYLMTISESLIGDTVVVKCPASVDLAIQPATILAVKPTQLAAKSETQNMTWPQSLKSDGRSVA